MRMAALSDTHGILPALEAVLADIEAQGVDGLLDAGDLVGGPQPVECVRLLRERGARMIRGNSDNGPLLYDAGQAPAEWRTSLQYALLRWAFRRLDRETLAFLAELPEQRVVRFPGMAPIRVVHGSPRDPAEHLVPSHDPERVQAFRQAGTMPRDRAPLAPDHALAQIDEPVLVCGHSHIPWKYERAGRLALNPGSVAGPLDGTIGAQYALLTWQDSRWKVEHRVIRYDLGRVRAAFGESGLLQEGGALARCFLLSIETGRNVAGDFLAYARGLAQRAGQSESPAIPDEIWEQAATMYGWDVAAAGRLQYLGW